MCFQEAVLQVSVDRYILRHHVQYLKYGHNDGEENHYPPHILEFISFVDFLLLQFYIPESTGIFIIRRKFYKRSDVVDIDFGALFK